MDIKEFSDQLRKQMDEQVEHIQQQEQDELKVTARTKSAIYDILIELKKFIHTYDFHDPQEEICFFKEIKPYFLTSYYYYDQLFLIKLKDSFNDPESRKKYYFRILKTLNAFQTRNSGFYQYWLTGSNQMDEKYFTSAANQSGNLNLDNHFSTGYDLLLSRLIANDKLKDYLQTALHKLDQNNNQESGLKWTGSKAALVELVYALQAVGVFNNGAADVKQVATAFEELFDLRLGNYYDVFQQIRMRKINPTKFLDVMKDRLILRINNVNKSQLFV